MPIVCSAGGSECKGPFLTIRLTHGAPEHLLISRRRKLTFAMFTTCPVERLGARQLHSVKLGVAVSLCQPADDDEFVVDHRNAGDASDGVGGIGVRRAADRLGPDAVGHGRRGFLRGEQPRLGGNADDVGLGDRDVLQRHGGRGKREVDERGCAGNQRNAVELRRRVSDAHRTHGVRT